jgi:transformation/transcription domain-associated protein
LSTLHRLQPLEVARQHAKELQRAMIALIREDNEENAIIALKVIIDLVRAFKGELESEVGGFLSLMGDLYKGMEATVQRSFESEAAQLNAMGAASGAAKADAVRTSGPGFAHSSSRHLYSLPTHQPARRRLPPSHKLPA